MPIINEIQGYIKCYSCKNQAFYECAICHNNFCREHIRYGKSRGYNIHSHNEYYCVACWRIERNTLLKTKTTKIQLITCLRKLGINAGDTLLVQTSVSSFGSIEGGAESIIDILLMLTGKQGTIVMPTFTPNAERFHVVSSRTHINCGVLCELFRKRKNTTRTNNPQFSFTAKGKFSVFIVNNAIKYEKLDELSPIQRIISKNGKIIMLGTEFDNCLPIIYAETISSKYSNHSCGKMYKTVEKELKKLNSFKEIIIGEALCRSYDVKELTETVKIILIEKPSFFNCGHTQCPQCGKQKKI